MGTATTAEVLAELESNPLFADLPAVQEQRYVPLSLETFTAISLPSALSVQYAIEEIVPSLAEAVRRRDTG